MNNRGFSLVEVMVSISLFSIVSAMMATSFTQLLKTNYDNEIRSGAYRAGERVIESYRQQAISTLPTTGSAAAQTITVNGRDYSVVPSFCAVASFCTTANIRHIRVTVNYENTKRYEVDSVFAEVQ
jgi:prepilin-type N-terminal cleavage/methylation domain-containing protein